MVALSLIKLIVHIQTYFLMKSFLRFIAGWIFVYVMFALICLMANWEQMNIVQCFHNEIVCALAIFLGWIGGMFATFDTDEF